MAYAVTLVPGEGIGPEIAEALKTAIAGTGVEIIWDEVPELGNGVGGLNPAFIESMKRTGVGIKGPTGTPAGGGHKSLNVQARQFFDLHAGVRPIKSLPGIGPFPGRNIDFLIVRENTEGEYAAIEMQTIGGAESTAQFTVDGSRAIAQSAFKLAQAAGRKKVVIDHKATIFKQTHGLFLETAKQVAAEYPDIECSDMLADNVQMQMVQYPEQFDVIVTTNLLGDLLSDLGAGLVGGLGVVPGANIGDDFALFEAVHGTAPDIAGRGIANPTAMILSGAMMLSHLGELTAAQKLRDAVTSVYQEGEYLTGDINKVDPVGTMVFAEAVVEAMLPDLAEA